LNAAIYTTLDPDLPPRFLKLLDPSEEGMVFQVCDDSPDKDGRLARVILGPAQTALPTSFRLHAERRVGVYITVNETNGKGRTKKDIIRVRAVFREADSPNLPPTPLAPTMVVETSPGHKHEYFLISDSWPADEQGRADFLAVMERMIESYGSDPGAKDISRVLRLPGFLHRKTKTPYLVRITQVHPQLRRYSRNEILAAFPPLPKQERVPLQLRNLPHRPYIEPSCRSPRNKVLGILAAVSQANEGNRNSIVFWAANRIVDMIADREIGHSEASNSLRALHAIGQKIGLSSQEIEQTIQSAAKRS
jgi:hypothetical protein